MQSARRRRSEHGHPSCTDSDMMRTHVLMNTRRRLPVRLPKHPTIAGWFWIAYFTAIGWLILG